MKIIAFIPSRYGSTRFPGKPLTLIGGMPMIQHVYQCALKCPDISEVYITTDDERIMECALRFKGRAILTGKNYRSGSDRIAEAAQRLRLKEDDLIVNIQGDQPIFMPSIISDMVKPLIEDHEIPMGTVKCLIEDDSEINNSNIVKVVTDERGFALYFSRHNIPFYRESGSFQQQYYKHLGFYVYRMGFLIEYTRLPLGILENAERLEQLRALEYGYRIKVVEVKFDSTEVDTPEDIIKVERILAKFQ